MALTEFPRHGMQPEEPDMGSSVSVTPEQALIHPLETPEGVLLLEQTPLPEFPDIGVESTRIWRRSDLDSVFGFAWRRDILMSDGTHIPEYIHIAKKPISDVPVVSEPAWWTSPERGFNQKTSEKLNFVGRHNVIHGIPDRAHSLYRNAHDVHVALDYADRDFSEFGTDEIEAHGDSNGAMEGTGVLAYAPLFGRKVLDAYFIDPALVHTIDRSDVAKYREHPCYALKEILSLGKQALRLALDPKENALDYIATLDLSKEFMLRNIKLARALFWGEFGHLLAHVPEDQTAYYKLFKHSIPNQKQTFLKVLRGPSGFRRQEVTTDVVPGVHLSIANPRTVNAKVNYLSQSAGVDSAA